MFWLHNNDTWSYIVSSVNPAWYTAVENHNKPFLYQTRTAFSKLSWTLNGKLTPMQMAVKMKPTACATKAGRMQYEKTCNIQNYSFSQIFIAELKFQPLSAAPSWVLVPAVNLHPTPGSTSTLSWAACNTEGRRRRREPVSLKTGKHHHMSKSKEQEVEKTSEPDRWGIKGYYNGPVPVACFLKVSQFPQREFIQPGSSYQYKCKYV